MEWALARGEKALFLPDEHLGRNTGYRMGIPLDQMAVWNPREEAGGLSEEEMRTARIYLVEGTLLRPPALPAPTRRARAPGASRHPRHRSPRVFLGSLPVGG